MSIKTAGNRLFTDCDCIQANRRRPNTLVSGHRACQGCGEALGARCVIDAACTEANGKIAVVNATGCLEVFSCSYPDNSWNVPWLHSLFGNAAAVASGVAAGFRCKGDTETRVIMQGGDGGMLDIGFGCLSGLFDRNDDVLCICYDNQAYMNTGVQRSSATPAYSRTATTAPNVRNSYFGNDERSGKNVPDIAMAHYIPYVATASIANIHDLERKVRKAIRIKGAKYIHVHVPCPLGWGYASSETINIARLAVRSGLFPLFEAEYGEFKGSTTIDEVIPVENYLCTQKRFAHLFPKGIPNKDLISRYQEIANRNIEKYRLTLE